MVKKSSYLSFLNRQKQKLWKSSRKNLTDENEDKYKTASLKFDSEVKKSSQKYEQSFIEPGNTTRLFSYIKKKLKGGESSSQFQWFTIAKIKLYFLIF